MKKIQKTILAVLLLSASCLSVQARSKVLDSFITKVSSSLVTFDYSFTCLVNGTKMTGDGKVELQDDCFRVQGNGLDIWCDGKTRWTIDTFAEEVVAESVGAAEGLMTNPALLITSVDDAFRETSSGSATFAGAAVDTSVLTPLTKGKSSMDIASLTLYFKKGTSTLSGVEVKLNDGTVTKFTLKNFSFGAKTKGKESFRFNEKTLDSSYVVTDLR